MRNNTSKKFNYESLRTYVSKVLRENLSSSNDVYSGKSDEGIDRIKKLRALTSESLERAKYGDSSIRAFVKDVIKSTITTELKGTLVDVTDYPKNFCVSPENIDSFLGLKSSNLSKYLKWQFLILKYQEEFGRKALTRIIEDCGADQKREDRYGELMYFVSDDDIDALYGNKAIRMTYSDKLQVLVQLLFEDLYGLGVTDVLYHQDKDEISYGEFGLINDDIPNIERFRKINVQKSYDAITVTVKGKRIKIDFLSFGSFEALEKACNNHLGKHPNNQFSRKDGATSSQGDDGSRRQLVRPPFGETFLMLNRFFNVEDKTMDELINGDGTVQNGDYVKKINEFLHKGCITHCVNGPQGVGKTSWMKEAIGASYPTKAIRLIETTLESNYRKKYPGRFIFTFQSVDDYLNETFAHETSLRTSGQINVVGEVRSHDMAVRLPENSQRGSDYTFFSYHPIYPENVPTQLATSFLEKKLFNSLEYALSYVLDFIKVTVSVKRDHATNNRYYEVYEFRKVKPKLRKDYHNVKNPIEKVAAFLDTMYDYMASRIDTSIYETVPILKFDLEKGAYYVMNRFSPELEERIKLNFETSEEREEFDLFFQVAGGGR